MVFNIVMVQFLKAVHTLLIAEKANISDKIFQFNGERFCVFSGL